MQVVRFTAHGHENIIGEHSTTLEITTEDFLTPRGTCIVGTRGTLSLDDLEDDLKELARSAQTKILLRLTANNMTEEIEGRGSSGLTYTDTISMVVRTSEYECGRTLMVRADKAASDLGREFVRGLIDPDCVIECELFFIVE